MGAAERIEDYIARTSSMFTSAQNRNAQGTALISPQAFNTMVVTGLRSRPEFDGFRNSAWISSNLHDPHQLAGDLTSYAHVNGLSSHVPAASSHFPAADHDTVMFAKADTICHNCGGAGHLARHCSSDPRPRLDSRLDPRLDLRPRLDQSSTQPQASTSQRQEPPGDSRTKYPNTRGRTGRRDRPRGYTNVAADEISGESDSDPDDFATVAFMVHADDDAGMLDLDLEDTSGIDWNEKFGKHPSSYDLGTSGHDTMMLASPSNPFSRPVLYRSWVIDTGATRHMTSSRQLLKHIKLLPRPIKIRTASNHQLICTHSGTARIPGLRGGTILLYDVLLSPDEGTPNLFSVSKAQSINTSLEINLTHSYATFTMGNTHILTAQKHKNLYMVPTSPFDHRQFDKETGREPGCPDFPLDTTSDLRTSYTPIRSGLNGHSPMPLCLAAVARDSPQSAAL